MQLLILWFAVGIGAALILLARGVRGPLWLCLAVLLGPLGTIAGRLSTLVCPHCERRIFRSETECPYCDEPVGGKQ